MKQNYLLLIIVCMAVSVSFSAVSCRIARPGENPGAAMAPAGETARVTTPAVEKPICGTAESILSAMSIEEKIGQLFLVDLWNSAGEPAVELTRQLISFIENVKPGGVVFYGANLKDPEQVRELTRSISKLLSIPPFLAIDHEGGTVNRLDDSGEIRATDIPPAADIGKTGIPELAYATGVVMGRELSSLGFNMNFAPVADVLSSPASMIGSRSFGGDPVPVARMVAMSVKGLQETGVSSVLKHFPGHGGVEGDTHSTAVYLDRKIDELFETELLPFAAGAGAGVDGIMAAHIVLGKPGSSAPPATVSKELLTGVLRDRFAYEGVVITDSLTMDALSSVERPVVEAIRAGADLLLTPGDEEAARKQLLDAISEGSLTIERIDESVLRILRVKQRRGLMSAASYTHTPDDALGCEVHGQIVSLIQRFQSSGE